MGEKQTWIKKYVDVTAEFTEEGRLIPRSILWEDGRSYTIDKVEQCSRRASLKAGGVGLRYTCRIGNAVRYLFYEENYRWFMEICAQMER